MGGGYKEEKVAGPDRRTSHPTDPVDFRSFVEI